MYIINNLMYGHNFSKNKELSDLLYEYDVYETQSKGSIEYKVQLPYHGGQVAGDIPSVMFGAFITDDDGNPSYVKELREAKEETYKEGYQEFVQYFLTAMKGSVEQDPSDEEYNEFVEKLERFLSENEPEFYSVESSS